MHRSLAITLTESCLLALGYRRLDEEALLSLVEDGKLLNSDGEQHRFKFKTGEAADAFLERVRQIFKKDIGQRVGSFIVTIPDAYLFRSTAAVRSFRGLSDQEFQAVKTELKAMGIPFSIRRITSPKRVRGSIAVLPTKRTNPDRRFDVEQLRRLISFFKKASLNQTHQGWDDVGEDLWPAMIEASVDRAEEANA